MLNIKYKGKYTNEQQLKEGFEPQPYLGVYKEIPRRKLLIFHYIIPITLLFIAVLLSAAAQVILARDIELYNDLTFLLNENVMFFMVFASIILVFIILSYIHELIHCLFYHFKAEKQIYSRLPYGLMVHCGEPVSKGRFILMVLAPGVLLGIIPFLLCTLIVWRINPQLSLYVTVLSSGMIASSSSDFVSAYKTIKQVPNGAKVFNYGIETYWV